MRRNPVPLAVGEYLDSADRENRADDGGGAAGNQAELKGREAAVFEAGQSSGRGDEEERRSPRRVVERRRIEGDNLDGR